MLDAHISNEPLSAEAELAAFLGGLDGAGAVVSFVGVTRDAARGGAAVERLFLDHHPALTERSVAAIGEAACERFDVSALRIVHRYGEVGPGEAIVFVATASAHRRAAFDAADYVMDRLKTEAMFWKREDTSDGSRWIEPTGGDYADSARWNA